MVQCSVCLCLKRGVISYGTVYRHSSVKMSDPEAIVSREVERDGHSYDSRRRNPSYVATLYVIDVGEATDSSNGRMVRYGRYIDTMAKLKVPSRVVGTAYVDSDRLRIAERALEEWMRSNGYATKYPMATIPLDVIDRIPDLMTIITSTHSGSKDDIIKQIEQKDETHAREIRYQKNKIHLRDEELRLKDYEVSLKDREISLLEYELRLLRNDGADNEAQYATM